MIETEGIPRPWRWRAEGQTVQVAHPPWARAPVTVSREQGSWDKPFSSSPIHSPRVGLCDPGAPCTRASPRGKRNAKDLEISAAPREFWGAGTGLPARRGREGIAADPRAVCRVWSSAGPLACQPSLGRTHAVVAASSPPVLLFHFLPLW